MSRIDPAVVLNKLNYMDNYLNELEKVRSISLDEYLNSTLYQRSIERLIQLIVQVGIDLNFYILKCLRRPLPETSNESVLGLVELNIIEPSLARNLQESIKLRNLLVHLYEEIDPITVHRSISNIFEDYPKYQKSILVYLQQSNLFE
ncbi:type VII toxin-antitoxin system HepT family RNase toxin [Baaleninema simplex]|uniref:type VII toxin-antitoxin system HepT family RNase toxin n=1 Tax=Baaleninema simplex TaxID=2862350 RepID=UPI00034CF23F|nr:DUF86 domain-containing protein [Baaleninema simplex]